jgi:hypothetical protein
LFSKTISQNKDRLNRGRNLSITLHEHCVQQVAGTREPTPDKMLERETSAEWEVCFVHCAAICANRKQLRNKFVVPEELAIRLCNASADSWLEKIFFNISKLPEV